MAIDLTYRPYLLDFKHPFGVSSNTRKNTPTVFIRMVCQGFTGYGEACLPVYLGETTEATLSFFEKARPLLSDTSLPFDLAAVLADVDGLAPGNNAAKAAIDMTLHDLSGKFLGKTVAAMYGVANNEPRATSFTIGIDSEDVVIQKLKEASGFSILKIKAGTEDDKKLISLIRKHSDKPLYVDVNQGWQDKEYVLDMILWMNEQNVVLIEQPMPVRMKKEMTWVTERSPIPTIADESVKRLKDLEALDGSFTGINIKLMKCTGIHEAVRMIGFCSRNNLLVLLGCMAESSCGTSAMTQLTSFADYIDLDAPLLYKNDPFTGVNYSGGMLSSSGLPGTGAAPLSALLTF